MKESTPTETKNGQIGKDNSTFLVGDNNTDQDADIKDTVQVKIEKMDDELSKIDGQETGLENQMIPNEEKDNFQKFNGDADTVVPSSVDVEMVDIGEIPKESRNEEEDVNEENKSQDKNVGDTAENQEGTGNICG
ncbi:unnamed protein product [[Candida] boidinii]|nr:unnamed protein product [[Candida] boidinii]